LPAHFRFFQRMKHGYPSSRRQFQEIRSELNGRRSLHAPRKGARGRDRSALALALGFFRLLRGYRLPVGFSLATLTLATLLGLAPPAATKFVLDNVLAGQSLPEWAPAWVPRQPWPLL